MGYYVVSLMLVKCYSSVGLVLVQCHSHVTSTLLYDAMLIFLYAYVNFHVHCTPIMPQMIPRRLEHLFNASISVKKIVVRKVSLFIPSSTLEGAKERFS